MGLLDYFDPDTLRGKLKGLLGGMPISQIARGDADVSREGLRAALMGIPVFDPKSGAQDAFNAGLGALTFAGVGAKTADKAALARAQKMAESGADRGAIWNETGWFKGPDNKWRFEIDDSGMRMANGGAARFKKLVDPELASTKQTRFAPISEVIKHDDLLNAYPGHAPNEYGVTHGLSDLIVHKDPSAWNEGGLSGNILTVSALKSSPKDFKETALHELQHWVQSQEGFARGGDSGAIKPLKMPPDIAKKAKELRKKFEALPGGSPERIDAVNQFDALTSPYSAHGQYLRLAGEAEARATQARMNFDAAKRKQIPPWESYDIPWDQLIVKY